MKKKILSVLLALVLVTVGSATALAVFPVLMDGEFVDVETVVRDGRTLLPARALVETLGGDVDWDATTRQATLVHDNTTIILTIGSTTALVNGQEVALDVPAQIINDRTFLPLRFIAENLGLEIDFYETARTVIIKTPANTLSDAALREIARAGTTASPQTPVPPNPIATIEMADGQIIRIELYPEMAPNTVTNFIYLANKGFYDGLTFHRLIPGFMIQGGCPEGTGRGNPGYAIKGEFAANGFTQNTLLHERGVVSMARAQPFDSAGSQFFIMHSRSPALDQAGYAAFGRVIEGMEVVDDIVMDPTTGSPSDTANYPRVIKSITVETFGIDFGEPEKLPR